MGNSDDGITRVFAPNHTERHPRSGGCLFFSFSLASETGLWYYVPMTANEAFEISMGSDLTSGPRNNALETVYQAIRHNAGMGLLNVSIHIDTPAVISQVYAVLRRDGFTVNPGFSSGDIIVGWA